MKLYKFLLIIFAMLFSIGTYAQDEKAASILDEVSKKTKSHKTITSTFVFTLSDKMAGVNESQNGEIKLMGDKFNLILGSNHIYSDGTTQWTYNEETNEVAIDHAQTGEDGGLNPNKIFTMWDSGFKKYYDKEAIENGETMDIIKLVPVDPSDKGYHTIKVWVNRSKKEVKKIEILGKEGQNYTYNVKTFKPDIAYTDKDFVFDKSKHPGVEVIDNR